MYLPTFWKLTTEATFYRMSHMAGYALPVGTLGKLILSITSQLIFALFLISTITNILT